MLLFLTILTGVLHLSILAVLLQAWKDKKKNDIFLHSPPLSIIVAAHNEEENLRILLPLLSELEVQGQCEFILVLDRCADRSVRVAKEHGKMDPRFRVIEIAEVPEGWAPKKYALSQAIATASHNQLVFTDADCRPEPKWLMGMQQEFAEGANLVIGLGPYDRHPGFLNAFIRHETYYTALLYIGTANLGRAYMAVGRNLGYTKSLWESAGGFSKHQARLSGDDDLFVNAVAKKARVATLLKPQTRVWSAPEQSWGSWFRQKQRHLSAGTAYPGAVTAFLALLHGLQTIFYLSLILVLCGTPGPLVAGILYLTRTTLAMALLSTVSPKWNAHAPIALFPLLDLGYILYHLVLIPASLLRKPKWKAD